MSERKAGSQALRLLTLAALALPGIEGAAQAEDEPAVTVRYSHYDEGQRDLNGQSYASLNLQPISVDSLAVDVAQGVGDRLTVRAHYAQDSWSGATPVVSLPNAAVEMQLMSGASTPAVLYTDAAHHPVVVDFDAYDPDSGTYATTPDARLVHVMASASPETRREGSLSAGFGIGRATVELGGGVSEEHDFHSRFVNLGGTLDLDRKLTTLNVLASYTWSRIDASLAANTAADWGAYTDRIHDRNGEPTLFGNRRDLSVELGITRVLNRDALLQFSVIGMRSSGLLENPYKAVILGFDDPDQIVDSSGLRFVPLKGVLEQRPDVRKQVSADVRYVQFVHALDTALHLEYRFYADDWGIASHTFSASLEKSLGGGWSLSPSIRYYSQGKASFYAPYFVFSEPYPAHPGGPLDFSQIPIDYFSSDSRLSGFGALSEAIGLTKRFDNGMKFELGYEHYAHRGGLKLGSGGEDGFADYSSSNVTASLSFDLDGTYPPQATDIEAAGSDDGSPTASPAPIPAGVSFAAMAGKQGTFGMDASYVSRGTRGGLRLDGTPVDGSAAASDACGTPPCTLYPVSASRSYTLLELRYGLTDWLTLEFAPQLVDNRIDLRDVEPGFAPFAGQIGPHPSGPDGSGPHQSGGLGDAVFAALVSVLDTPLQHAHLGLGVGIPLGDDGLRLNGQSDQASYALQRGSGTWTIRPSVTYTIGGDGIFGGVQISAVKSLERRNSHGYRPGNEVDATIWAGFSPLSWLSLSGRIEYRDQKAVSGGFAPHLAHDVPEEEEVQADYDANGDGVIDANDTEIVIVFRDELQPHVIAGPEDDPGNYGGATWSGGISLAVTIPGGTLRGDTLSLEWLEPLGSELNGFQLDPGRTIALRLGVRL